MIIPSIDQAANELKLGNLVAIPTETVYGLAANAFDDNAIKKIFQLKGRPLNNPLIVHIYSFEQLYEIADDVDECVLKLAQHYWPGPLTLILKKKKHISPLLTAAQDTIAVRIPQHPITLKLLKSLSFPLAAPSANPYKRISPTSAQHVENYFKDLLILEGGECSKGIESTIIGFENNQPVIYRPGSITKENIEELLLKKVLNNTIEKNTITPGMASKHYSPQTPSILSYNIEKELGRNKEKRIGLLLFKKRNITHPNIHIEMLSENEKEEEAAKKLYQCLHYLDTLKLDLIIMEALPTKGLGESINDRLRRAAN